MLKSRVRLKMHDDLSLPTERQFWEPIQLQLLRQRNPSVNGNSPNVCSHFRDAVIHWKNASCEVLSPFFAGALRPYWRVKSRTQKALERSAEVSRQQADLFRANIKTLRDTIHNTERLVHEAEAELQKPRKRKKPGV